MAKRKTTTKTPEILLETIVATAADKKGKDIVILDLRNISNRVCDHFVICHADSNVHIQSIVAGIEEQVKNSLGERAFSREGKQSNTWVLLDYVNVVVHVFQAEFRRHYDLEGLWADAVITRLALEPDKAN